MTHSSFRNWSSPQYQRLNNLSSSEMEELMLALTPKPFNFSYFGSKVISKEEFKLVFTDAGKIANDARIVGKVG